MHVRRVFWPGAVTCVASLHRQMPRRAQTHCVLRSASRASVRSASRASVLDVSILRSASHASVLDVCLSVRSVLQVPSRHQ